ncbi:MAG: hypothetical protein AB1529_01815 [Candidatus Micrarchaeota archaeon]
MSSRALVLCLLLLSMSFATAPSWVAPGASLNYSAGSDAVSFTVLSRNSTDIRIQIAVSSAPKPSTGTENASGNSGQFWFDSSLLATAKTGSSIGDFKVKGSSTQSFAGETWETVTLEATLSGAKTTRIYDKKSGLMLKQTVEASGAPEVILSKYYFPSAAPPPSSPPAQPPANATPPSNGSGTPPATPPPSQPPSQPNETSPPSGTGGEPYQPSQPSAEPSGEEPPEEPAPEPPKKRPITEVCSGAFILALLGFAALRGRQ